MLQESKAPNATITIRIEAQPEYAAGASQTVALAGACATSGQVYQAEPVTYSATTGATMVSSSAPAVGGGVQYMSGTSISGGAPSYATTMAAGQPATYSSACPARAGQPTVYSNIGQSPTMYGASPVATKVEYQSAVGQPSPPPGYQMYTGPIYNSQTARPSMPSVASFTSTQSPAAVEPTVCAAPSQSTAIIGASAPAPTYSQAPATTTYAQAAAPVTYSQQYTGVTNLPMPAAMPAAMPSALPANSASSTARPLTIFSSPTQPQQVTQAPVPVSTMYATPQATMATTSPAFKGTPVGTSFAQQGAPMTFVTPAPAATFAPATTYATPQMTASQQVAGVPPAATYTSAPATPFTGCPPQASTRGQTYTVAAPGQTYPVPTPGGYPMVGSTAPTVTFQQAPMQVQGGQPVAYAAPTMISAPGMQPGVFQAGMQPTILPGGAVTAGMQQPGLIQGVQPGFFQPGVQMSGMQMNNAPGGTFETTIH